VELGWFHACAQVVNVGAGGGAAADELGCWGNNADGQLGTGVAGAPEAAAVPADAFNNGGRRAVEFSLGEDHTCAIDGNGSLWCWGGNGTGQLGTGDNDPRDSPFEVVSCQK
jgi:alpha-tubulin suppressor-like RCC1 family protein